jgi:hypothetical protein
MSYAKDLTGAGFSAGQASAIGGAGGTYAAAGSVAGDATAVKGVGVALITGADGTKGVILDAGQPGDTVTIFNNSGSTLKVYPPTGAAIAVPGTGVGTANAAFSHLTYKTVMYECYSGTQWFPIVTT